MFEIKHGCKAQRQSQRRQCPHKAGASVIQTQARNAGCQPTQRKGRNGFSLLASSGNITLQYCHRMAGESFTLSSKSHRETRRKAVTLVLITLSSRAWENKFLDPEAYSSKPWIKEAYGFKLSELEAYCSSWSSWDVLLWAQSASTYCRVAIPELWLYLNLQLW